MTTNIVTATFGSSRITRTRALYQWDYGQVLRFADLELPSAYTVHFSNQGIDGTAKTAIGNSDGVTIPGEYLLTGQDIYAWVYLHTGEDDGETRYTVIVPVTARSRPVDEEPTPVQQGVIDQAIAALNAGVEAAQEAAESVQNMGVDAETLAPGSDATVEKTVEDGVVTLTFGIPRGDKGERGEQGVQGERGETGSPGPAGEDGISPTITVTDIAGGHRVTITDATGPHSFDVLDGETGADGFSPIARVEQTATGATITITDAEGTTTAEISNGAMGPQGIPGPQGDPGEGVAPGGTTGQMLVKKTDADYDTEWVDQPQTMEIDPTLTISGAAADAKTTGDAILDLYPVATAGPSAIVSVDDAAPLDAERLVTQIEPVQDLHGYDHPWPAGGGTNIANPDDVQYNSHYVTFDKANNQITISGNSTNFIFWMRDLMANDQFMFSSRITSVAGGFGNLQIRNSANVSVATTSNINAAGFASLSFTVPESGDYSFRVRTETATSLTAVESQIVRGGTVVPYSPYSNICPITGWTGATVKGTGVNVLNPDVDSYALNRAYRYNLNVVPNGASARMTFTDKDTSVDVSGCYIGFIQSNYDMQSMQSPQLFRWCMQNGVVNANTTNSAITNTSYLCSGVFIYPNDIATFNKIFSRYNIMIELGSTATAYEPYQGTTLPVTFPASAGTVYGGYVDLVNGKLVVDRAEVDLGTLTWSNRGFNAQAGFAALGLSGGRIITGYDGIMEKAVCSIYSIGSNGSMSNASSDMSVAVGAYYASGCNVYVRDSRFTDAVTFKAAMSGVQLVYELATPITYDIDPVTLTLLRGDNNVWADTGSVTLTYRQDVAMLLSRINEHTRTTRSMIAGIETTMTATRPYSTGELLIVGNTLYRVTTPIANGATFTPGTNVTATTVAEQLLLLANT